MQRIIHIGVFVFALACLAWIIYQVHQQSRIHYVGKLSYGEKVEGGWANQGTVVGTIDGHYEIGLRGDNVIVWRKAGEK